MVSPALRISQRRAEDNPQFRHHLAVQHVQILLALFVNALDGNKWCRLERASQPSSDTPRPSSGEINNSTTEMNLLQKLFLFCRRRKPQSTATITPSESIPLLPRGKHSQNMIHDVENVTVNGGTFIFIVGMSSLLSNSALIKYAMSQDQHHLVMQWMLATMGLVQLI